MIPFFNDIEARKNLPEAMIHPRTKRFIVFECLPPLTGEIKVRKKPDSGYSWKNPKSWISYDDAIKKIEKKYNQIHEAIDDTEVRYKQMWKYRSENRTGCNITEIRYYPGFALTQDYSLCFIDLDHCILPGGALTPTGAKYYSALKNDAFIEKSVTGDGIHIFCWFDKKIRLPNNPEPGVEIYTDKRVVCLTGVKYNE